MVRSVGDVGWPMRRGFPVCLGLQDQEAVCPLWERSPLIDGDGNQVTEGSGAVGATGGGTACGENPFKQEGCSGERVCQVEKKGGDTSLCTC